jgi:hypothetical protein
MRGCTPGLSSRNHERFWEFPGENFEIALVMGGDGQRAIPAPQVVTELKLTNKDLSPDEAREVVFR